MGFFCCGLVRLLLFCVAGLFVFVGFLFVFCLFVFCLGVVVFLFFFGGGFKVIIKLV